MTTASLRRVRRDEPPEPRTVPVYRTAQWHGLELMVRKLDRENARLRALLAEHGIDPGPVR